MDWFRPPWARPRVPATAQPSVSPIPRHAVPNPDRPHIVIVYRQHGKFIYNAKSLRAAFELGEKLMTTVGATRCEIEPAWEFRPERAA